MQVRRTQIRSVGSTSSCFLRLYGVILLGKHTIHIVRFDPDVISSRNDNGHMPVRNYNIGLKRLDKNRTRYADRAEIDTGWKAVFVWLWVNAFYTHRQRRWIRPVGVVRRRKK